MIKNDKLSQEKELLKKKSALDMKINKDLVEDARLSSISVYFWEKEMSNIFEKMDELEKREVLDEEAEREFYSWSKKLELLIAKGEQEIKTLEKLTAKARDLSDEALEVDLSLINLRAKNKS